MAHDGDVVLVTAGDHAASGGALPPGSEARVHHVQSTSSFGGVSRLGTGQPIVVIDSSD